MLDLEDPEEGRADQHQRAGEDVAGMAARTFVGREFPKQFRGRLDLGSGMGRLTPMPTFPPCYSMRQAMAMPMGVTRSTYRKIVAVLTACER